MKVARVDVTGVGVKSTDLIRGLYAVTPDEADTAALLDKAARALRGGAAVLQYRNKTATAALKRQQAAALVTLCRAHDAIFIVNDDVGLALEVDAHGVHLGGEDGDLSEARRRIGPAKLLGASCYNRMALGIAAKAAGADHVAFGAAFASPTKPAAVNASLDLYRRAAAEIGLPVVAIGGITLSNAGTLIAAGVDAVAVITDLFGAPDVEQQAMAFKALFRLRSTST
jgi:thiamine-phosphate pyrophosphorylase